MTMTMTMTKWQLMSLLTTNGTSSLILPDGRQGILQSVLRESGSGRTFVLTVAMRDRTTENVFCRTTD